jgi:two-component system, sensor histidine kinase PdtaS
LLNRVPTKVKWLCLDIMLCFAVSIVFGQSATTPSVLKSDTSQVIEWLKQSERASDLDDSFLLVQKALVLSEKLQYNAGIAHSQVMRGNILFKRKNYAQALEYYEKAKPILKQMNDDVQLAGVLKNSGDCYSARSYFRQAFDSYREASVFFRKTGQLKLLNECLDAMGNLALDFGQTRGAITHYKRSLSAKSALNDQPGILATTSKISKAYLTLMQYDSALYFNKEVQHLAKSNTSVLTDAAIDEFIILSFQRKLVEANEAKQTAEQLVKQQNNSSMTIRLLAATSNYYLAQKDKERADTYFDSAATLIQAAKNPELAITGLSMLAEMSRQNDDYKTAYRMMKQADNFKDIFRTENMERISAEIRNASEAALKEKEIEYLSRENTLKAEKLNREAELRRALLRQNQLIDSSLERQRLLTTAKDVEGKLRDEQLAKEKELRLSLSRENELKEESLNAERKIRILLWLGIGSLITFGSLLFVQYRKQRTNNEIIRRQSEDLQVLNKEIHHRVKNNLQVISSMLDLQSQSLNDERATEIIKEAIQRVQSMAFIHQNLYQGDAVNSVNMNEYIKILSDHLFHSYNIRPEKIKLHTQIENFRLHTDSAIPLGMILNELMSNSLKYAFKEKEEGDIWVTMKKNGNELFLQVKDNGVGLPAGFTPENTSSFGFEVINAFAQKLRARMHIEGSNGVDAQLIISKFKMAE